MDHRKLLVVILSVTLFAALVLGISLLALYPGADGAPEGAQTADSRRAFDPIEYVRSSDGPLGIVEDDEADDEEDEDGDLVIVYGSREDQQDADADAAARDARDDSAADEGDAAAGDATTRGVDAAAQAQQPSQADGQTAEDERQAQQPREPAETAPEPAPREPQQQRQPQTPPRDPGPSSTQTAAAREVTNEYWIQVVSSPNRDTVEQARETLQQRSLGSVIFPIEIEGTRFYRLRVGPYPDRQEADKFLVWIRDLPGFAESYVSVVFRA